MYDDSKQPILNVQPFFNASLDTRHITTKRNDIGLQKLYLSIEVLNSEKNVRRMFREMGEKRYVIVRYHTELLVAELFRQRCI